VAQVGRALLPEYVQPMDDTKLGVFWVIPVWRVRDLVRRRLSSHAGRIWTAFSTPRPSSSAPFRSPRSSGAAVERQEPRADS